jgi:hypothetical protein
MRAFYSTYQHVRVFVLGVPEGWHVTAYDLQGRQWIPIDDRHPTLKQAKIAAEARATAITGKRAAALKWR